MSRKIGDVEFYSRKEAARRLGIDPQTLQKAVNKGQVVSYHDPITARWLFLKEVIDSMVRQSHEQALPKEAIRSTG